MSAIKEGSIVECGLSLTLSAPYFFIHPWEYKHDVYKFNRCFEDYVKTCMEGPDKVEDLVKGAKELLVRAEELKDNIKGEAESANLNPLEIARAVSNTIHNIVTLKDGI